VALAYHDFNALAIAAFDKVYSFGKKELAGFSNLPALYLGLYLGLMALGVVAVLTTAWLGGELVYRLRVGVQ
jgi:hypothetical protein